MATKIVMMLLGLTLILIVACGGAPAAPEPTAAPAAEPTAAPVESEPSQPTSTPQEAAPPAEVEVNPGKLTWLIPGMGNERFVPNYGVGGGNNYGRILHGFPIATNEKTELLPGIATRWEVSRDGKTWTFTIRDEAKFHDGSALTADDVWWTWMNYWGKDESGSALDRVTSSAAQGLARIVEGIERVGPNQVSITTDIADAGLPPYISEAGPNWWGVLPRRPKVHDDAQEAAYDMNPIAAGPMKLVQHVIADLMAFERFDDYYYQPENGLPEDRRPKFQSLDVRLVPEEATRVAALRAGEADIAPASVATRSQVEAGGGRLVFGPEGLYLRVLPLGCYNPQYPCHDKRVRQALDYAIDKELMQDQLWGSEVFQVKGWQYVTPSAIGYSSDLDPWPFDPEKARQLLAEAGYPGGEDFGKLIVNTWVSIGMPFLPESAQIAADSWRRELGLDVEVRVGDQAALNLLTTSGDLDGQLLWRENEARFDPGNLTRQSYGTPGHSRRLHENQEIFDLVQEALMIFEPAERSAAFNRVFQRLREETYELGIGYVNIPWAVGPRVVEWQPWPLSFYPSALHTITLK
ncbi:MAG TPA: ABC transporter substrate-binding protein [Dehalococcoidia bacterium]|nr:ABC transporter substrate-binding protein [Dehalococcoidia bacterium]